MLGLSLLVCACLYLHMDFHTTPAPASLSHFGVIDFTGTSGMQHATCPAMPCHAMPRLKCVCCVIPVQARGRHSPPASSTTNQTLVIDEQPARGQHVEISMLGAGTVLPIPTLSLRCHHRTAIGICALRVVHCALRVARCVMCAFMCRY